MRVRYAGAAGVALIALAVGLFLFIPAKRVIGSNLVHPFLPVKELNPNERICDEVNAIPAGTESVRLKAESPGGVVEELRVKFSAGPRSRSSADGRMKPNGIFSLPVYDGPAGKKDVRVCIYNLGRRDITLFGEFKRPEGDKIDGVSTLRNQRNVSLVFVEGRATTWFSHKSKVSELFGYGHAGAIGAWALWLAAGMAAFAAGLALWRVIRDAEGA